MSLARQGGVIVRDVEVIRLFTFPRICTRGGHSAVYTGYKSWKSQTRKKTCNERLLRYKPCSGSSLLPTRICKVVFPGRQDASVERETQPRVFWTVTTMATMPIERLPSAQPIHTTFQVLLRHGLGPSVGGHAARFDSNRANLVGLGQSELRSYKMRTSRLTVIISKQMICTAKFKFKTLHVQKRPSRSSKFASSKFGLAMSYHIGST